MVLQGLSDKISKAFQNLRKNLTIDNDAIVNMLNEIKEALLGADIPVESVDTLLKNCKKSFLSPDFKKYAHKQSVISQTVYIQLVKLLDPGVKAFEPKKGRTNILMFVGLQGSGKTTTIAKYALYFKRRKWKCALVCADTFRAGAFDQLKQNATKVGVPFYGSHTETDPVKLAADGVSQFKSEDYDVILVDTSGRHKQEKSLFREMSQIEKAIKPDDIVFIMDGTIGQAAMSQATAFKKTVNIGSCIITKLDGNTKGGGALAAVAATKSPITYIGYGEHFPDFEEFKPKGFASRLLGFGDPQALIDKLPELADFDEEKGEEMFKRMVKGTFTMRDLHEQLNLVTKMGSLTEAINLISPQMAKAMSAKCEDKGLSLEVIFKKYLTIMDSMTDDELDNPNFSTLGKDLGRIRRLALGSGCSMMDVSNLFGQYKEFKRVFGILGKKFNLNELKKHKDDPAMLMKMMNSMMPGGAKNMGKMQKMYQQIQRMGGVTERDENENEKIGNL